MLAVPNVTGPKQSKTLEFFDHDIPPVHPEPAKSERPALPAHCEEFYHLARWFLASEDSPIIKAVRDLFADLSACDREECRHAIGIEFWLKAVSAETRGAQPTRSARIVLASLKRLLQRQGRLPQTVAHVSHDEAKAAKELIDSKRLERLEADHMRIVAQERANAKREAVAVQVIRF